VGFCCVGLGHFVMCGNANEVVVVVVGLRGGKGGGEGGVGKGSGECVPGRSTRKLHRDLRKVSKVWSD